jgi:preprotein translocase SecE subunit
MATIADRVKTNPWDRLRNYVLEVRTEIDKVTWPSFDDLKAHTVIVLVFLGILSLIVGAMDVTFQKAVLTLFRNIH